MPYIYLRKRKNATGVFVDFVCPKSLTLHKGSFFWYKDITKEDET